MKSRLVRPCVQKLHAYQPGEQPKIPGLIKLNTNENPYPPSPKVLRALREEPATRDLPVIVVTAKDLTDEDRTRLARNAQRVILKQATPLGELRQEIQSVLLARGVESNRVDDGNGLEERGRQDG